MTLCWSVAEMRTYLVRIFICRHAWAVKQTRYHAEDMDTFLWMGMWKMANQPFRVVSSQAFFVLGGLVPTGPSWRKRDTTNLNPCLIFYIYPQVADVLPGTVNANTRAPFGLRCANQDVNKHIAGKN
jgi:hypothetical protein